MSEVDELREQLSQRDAQIAQLQGGLNKLSMRYGAAVFNGEELAEENATLKRQIAQLQREGTEAPRLDVVV